MASVNKVLLLGRVGTEPESKVTSKGTTVVNFTVGTPEIVTNINTGKKEERTEWHRIVAYGKLAENCAWYLKKGSKVYIEGKLRTRKWEDAKGDLHMITEIIAERVVFLGERSTDEETSFEEVE